jgi:DNA-binding NarL/FixJ family response regulator
VARVLEAGAAAYLLKPCSTERLAVAIEAALHGYRDAMTFGV